MRNVVAAILLFISLIAGVVGTTLQWLHHAAHSPETTTELVRGIATDRLFIESVSSRLVQTLTEHVPDAVASIPGAQESLADAIQAGITATIDQPEVAAVWQRILNDTRVQLVSDLGSYGLRGGTPPAVTIDLAPIASVVWQHVLSNHPLIAAGLKDVELPAEIPVQVTTLSPQVADAASGALQLAGLWWLLMIVAVVLLLGGLILATGLPRWVLLAVIGALGIVMVWVIQFLLTMVNIPVSENTIVQALGSSTVRLLGQSLSAWYTWLWYGFLAAVAIGIIGAITTKVKGRRVTSG